MNLDAGLQFPYPHGSWGSQLKASLASVSSGMDLLVRTGSRGAGLPHPCLLAQTSPEGARLDSGGAEVVGENGSHTQVWTLSCQGCSWRDLEGPGRAYALLAW